MEDDSSKGKDHEDGGSKEGDSSKEENHEDGGIKKGDHADRGSSDDSSKEDHEDSGSMESEDYQWMGDPAMITLKEAASKQSF
ncbi:hypothetical protein EMCRGX_G014924 [Ephydatia muelleri]|eukprot:Em0005g1101a